VFVSSFHIDKVFLQKYFNLEPLPASLEIRPLARLNESGPVESVLPVLAPYHFQLNLAKRCSPPLPVLQARIVGGHELACDVIAYLPQAHNQRLRAGKNQCSPEAVNTLAVPYLSQSCVARRQGDQSGSPEI